MASDIDELLAMSDAELDAEVERLGGDPAKIAAEATKLVDRLGRIRDAGVAAERARVAEVLGSVDVFAYLRKCMDGSSHAADDAVDWLASKLGIATKGADDAG